MATKKPTQMIVTAGTQQDGTNSMKDQLEKRAARFKLGSTAPVNNPASDEKLAARAARFADVNKGAPVATNSGKGFAAANAAKAALTAAAHNPAEAEKLAKRAAKFADVLPAAKTAGKVSISTSSTSNSTVPSSAVDKDILAKRAARFAANNSASK